MVHLTKLAAYQKSYRSTNYSRDVTERRVILLLDMDCFEVQVHQDKWMAAEEYPPPRVAINADGAIVSVSYEAKRYGINRKNTPYFDQAKRICPDLVGIRIPNRPNSRRPDTGIALRATASIVSTIQKFLQNNYPEATFQFASNDEFYVDVTDVVNTMLPDHRSRIEALEILENNYWEKTYIYNNVPEKFQRISNNDFEFYNNRIQRLGRQHWKYFSCMEWQEVRLLLGATIANQIVREILHHTTFKSSVGIGSNKVMAKIASGVQKPGSITVVAPSGFWKFSKLVPFSKIPGLGGEIGNAILEYNLGGSDKIARIHRIKLRRLMEIIQATNSSLPAKAKQKALELKALAFGLCSDPVIPQNCYKTSGVQRNLKGEQFSSTGLRTILHETCIEIMEKLEHELSVNGRRPKDLNLKIQFVDETETISVKMEMSNILPPYSTNEVERRFGEFLPKRGVFTAKLISMSANF